MSSQFAGLQSALSALQAQQALIETVGHNIANADTPGYTRQRANLQSAPSPDATMKTAAPQAGAVGGGVIVASYERLRDSFIDLETRNQYASQAQYANDQTTLGNVESALNEPSDTGIQSSLATFFSDWQKMATDPTSIASRQVLVQDSASLAGQIADLHNSLTSNINDLNNKLGTDVADINTVAAQIATLNKQIGNTVAVGEQPNDLLDQRDLLIDKLATYAGPLTISTDSLDKATITMAGVNIVDPTQPGGVTALTAADVTASQPPAGELRSLSDLANTTIPGYISNLDTMTTALINTVNTQHAAGYDMYGNPGGTFFTGTDSSNIGVSAALMADPNKVAASSVNNAVGDSMNAQAMADLQDSLVAGGSTIGSFYSSLVSKIGQDSKTAQSNGANATVLVNNMESRRQETSGVNIDEELTTMLQAQHAYSAAAKALSTEDQMIQDLLDKVG
jgi:flagellar hook-associated protein 1 FlgK